MYCILRYIEFHDFQKQMAAEEKPVRVTDSKHTHTGSEKLSTLSATTTTTTATSVRTHSIALSKGSKGGSGLAFGTHNNEKKKQLYFNPNCFVQLILDYICEEVGIKTESDFDLCNEEGDLLKIKDYEPLSNGTAIFTPRENYFVTLQARNSLGKIADVEILLNRASEEYIAVSTNVMAKIPKRLLSIDKQNVTFRKKRGSKSSKDSSKTAFDFTHGFGTQKKYKRIPSKSSQPSAQNLNRKQSA